MSSLAVKADTVEFIIYVRNYVLFTATAGGGVMHEVSRAIDISFRFRSLIFKTTK